LLAKEQRVDPVSHRVQDPVQPRERVKSGRRAACRATHKGGSRRRGFCSKKVGRRRSASGSSAFRRRVYGLLPPLQREPKAVLRVEALDLRGMEEELTKKKENIHGDDESKKRGPCARLGDVTCARSCFGERRYQTCARARPSKKAHLGDVADAGHAHAAERLRPAARVHLGGVGRGQKGPPARVVGSVGRRGVGLGGGVGRELRFELRDPP
jgi:hypothetical protein